MGKIEQFTDLLAWQEAKVLVKLVYHATEKLPANEQFGLSSQLRRAAVSVAANIAEGFSRYSYKDRVRFYYQARGSISEVLSHALIAVDVFRLSPDWIAAIEIQAAKTKALLNGLIKETTRRSAA